MRVSNQTSFPLQHAFSTRGTPDEVVADTQMSNSEWPVSVTRSSRRSCMRYASGSSSPTRRSCTAVYPDRTDPNTCRRPGLPQSPRHVSLNWPAREEEQSRTSTPGVAKAKNTCITRTIQYFSNLPRPPIAAAPTAPTPTCSLPDQHEPLLKSLTPAEQVRLGERKKRPTLTLGHAQLSHAPEGDLRQTCETACRIKRETKR